MDDPYPSMCKLVPIWLYIIVTYYGRKHFTIRMLFYLLPCFWKLFIYPSSRDRFFVSNLSKRYIDAITTLTSGQMVNCLQVTWFSLYGNSIQTCPLNFMLNYMMPNSIFLHSLLVEANDVIRLYCVCVRKNRFHGKSFIAKYE